jgi:hypothetical protein
MMLLLLVVEAPNTCQHREQVPERFYQALAAYPLLLHNTSGSKGWPERAQRAVYLIREAQGKTT